MRTRTLLLLCLVVPLLGQSPRPRPAPRVLAESQQEKSRQNQTKTDSNKAESELLPSSTAEPTANPKTKGKKTYSTNAGETTARNDVANWFVAAFTFVLAVVAVLQWKTLTQQAKYMRYALRPRIKIRNVEIDTIDSLVRGEPIDTAGTLQIYNSGGSDAHVLGITCRLFAFDKLPMRAPFASPDQSADIRLPPGVYGTRSFPFDAVDFQQFKGIREKTIGLYIMGELAYADEMGLRRTTRFCRRFDWEKERFFPVDDPDYESDDY